MAHPFTCPFCGAHNYNVVLTGCDIGGATVEEEFLWEPDSADYASSGAVIVDSASVESEQAQAFCSQCEKDVSEALAQYEARQSPGGTA
jgi:Zn finger protein HypA/HybF involved in hydrogenase expression